MSEPYEAAGHDPQDLLKRRTAQCDRLAGQDQFATQAEQ